MPLHDALVGSQREDSFPRWGRMSPRRARAAFGVWVIAVAIYAMFRAAKPLYRLSRVDGACDREGQVRNGVPVNFPGSPVSKMLKQTKRHSAAPASPCEEHAQYCLGEHRRDEQSIRSLAVIHRIRIVCEQLLRAPYVLRDGS
jgi:hypothetical protein